MKRGAFSSHLAALRALLAMTVVLGVAYPLGVTLVAQLPGLRDNAAGSLITDADGEVVGSELIGQSFTDAAGEPIVTYFQSRPSMAADDTGAPYDPTATAASNLGPEHVVDTLPDPELGWEGDENASMSLLTRVCSRSFEVGRLENVDGSRPYCAESGGSAVGAVLGVYHSEGVRGTVTRVVSLNESCDTVTEPFITEYRGVTVECAVYGEDHSGAVPVPVAGDAPADPVVPADAVAASASGLDPHISVEYARLQAPRVAAERGVPEGVVNALIDAHTTGRSLWVLGDPGVNVVTLNLALDRDHPVTSAGR
ncbi:K+-transporting ATPase ATPase C chain [Stackebrandtia albiflava]|uniref:Potassium-transporting ATPase KdpC subunit n=1 Tax=Stackebrandtia albiflava TaxID=406432 RepID=A0A562VAZ5_9ACTN|nr:potassium-transporting ATPase subunit C [Stackebrandtia albiflava]TWJ15034.1 K+-transporting ATPase ATPase C chain [Stackebrandtia albiflava]